MRRKSKLHSDPDWIRLLNSAGLGLMLAMLIMTMDRVYSLGFLPSGLTPKIEDLVSTLTVFGTIGMMVITVFCAHPKTKAQMTWLEKTSIPFWLGMASAGAYLAFIALTPR